MTTRKPIVNVNGDLAELPAGDDASLAFLAALGQILGDTSANILEIEAANDAARVVYEPMAGGGARELNFDVGHYATSTHIQQNASTGAFSASEMVSVGNVRGAVIGIVRRVTAMAATNSVVGARAGVCSIQMSELFGAKDMSGNSFIPPFFSPGDGFTATLDYASLNSKQMAPNLIFQRISNANPSAGSYSALRSGAFQSQFVGGAQSAVGMNIPPAHLFDHRVNGPLILPPYSGFSVMWSYPTAVTSQQNIGFVRIAWDEWRMRHAIN